MPTANTPIKMSELTVKSTVNANDIILAANTTNNFVYTANTIRNFVYANNIMLSAYTVNAVPNANIANTTIPRLIFVSNGANGNPCLAVSNGSNWFRIDLSTVISAT